VLYEVIRGEWGECQWRTCRNAASPTLKYSAN